MPDTLARALRDVIDASAEPVTADEVLGLPVTKLRPKRRWPVLAAAAVVLLAVIGGMVLAGQGDGDDTADQVTASTPTVTTALETPPIESCRSRVLIVDGPSTPCPVSDAQAEVMLDIPINEPEGIPEGWTRVHHQVRWYEADEWGLPHDLADYNRSWWEDPTQVNESVPCDGERDGGCWPPYIQVNVRESLPNDERDRRAAGVAGQLDDGTPVWGSINPPRLGEELSTWISWVRDGRYYRLRSSWVPRETVLEVASSLN